MGGVIGFDAAQPSGGGAAAHPTPDWVNVLDYGADPTGAKDSTSAIQAAIDAAATNPSGYIPPVYLPAGTYLVTPGATPTLNADGNLVRMIGDSAGGQTQLSLSSASASGDVLFSIPSYGAVFEHVEFYGANTSADVTWFSIASGAKGVVFRRCAFAFLNPSWIACNNTAAGSVLLSFEGCQWLVAPSGSTIASLQTAKLTGKYRIQTSAPMPPLVSWGGSDLSTGTNSLPSPSLSSGTAWTNATLYAVEVYWSVTLNPTASAAATVTAAVSGPPGSATLVNESAPAGSPSGVARTYRVRVPPLWSLTVTVTNATIGTAVSMTV